MKRPALGLVVFLIPLGLCYGKQPPRPQVLPLSEVSGAVNIGGDRVLVIADEGFQVQQVSEAREAFEKDAFKGRMKPLFPNTSGKKETKKIIDDIEDVAWDPARETAFVITSHSRSKSQDQVANPKGEKPQRHKLARLAMKNGKVDSGRDIVEIEDLLKGFSFVVEAMAKPHQSGGEQGTFNIEGLVFDPSQGRLLIGLRSPTQAHQGKPDAVVLALKNPHALFEASPEKAAFDPHPMFLDLEGAGIRGMTWDSERKGVWIVAGRSADPDTPSDHVLSSVWFWDPHHADRQPRKASPDLLGLESLESICLLDRSGKHGLLLISDDGGDSQESRYLWVPVPEL